MNNKLLTLTGPERAAIYRLAAERYEEKSYWSTGDKSFHYSTEPRHAGCFHILYAAQELYDVKRLFAIKGMQANYTIIGYHMWSAPEWYMIHPQFGCNVTFWWSLEDKESRILGLLLAAEIAEDSTESIEYIALDSDAGYWDLIGYRPGD